ncbi:hypothetical protein PRIPAC_75977 [Pristionchus pacificus]|uniref:RING-type domain-containing protein n=1 Tax=Pristionchus pacificus TaxID=54126 RepID=A0A2A6C999_PRIPA|nr:hypothetical protein PRIPAC_75977 [Pristionchus pacificus]|eukprot:PDM74670.1 hypothetical protein PRIPAC_42026 [Pristionchus pacificus]
MTASSCRVFVTDDITGEISERNIDEYIRELREKDELSALHGYRFYSVCRACGSKEPRRRAVCECLRVHCVDCAKSAHHPCTYTRIIEEEDGSRECGICCSVNPHCRALFKQCGHITCRACALQLNVASTEYLEAACPYCRVQSRVMLWREHRIIEDKPLNPSSPVLGPS